MIDESSSNLNGDHFTKGSSEFALTTSGEESLYDLLLEDELKQQSNRFLSAQEKQRDFEASLSYLRDLNSYHIDRLQAEPTLLLDSKVQLQEDIKNLAFSNYKTFIRTAQCSKEIYADFSVIDSKLDNLSVKLPEFNSLCENFTKSIQDINASRRANNLTLQTNNPRL